jgi:hypothetical protein
MSTLTNTTPSDTAGPRLMLSARSPEHAVRPALTELAAFATGLTPSRITSNAPGPEDAQALVDDLLLLCAKVDRVVEAYGEYANAHFSTRIDMKLFKNQLLDALEGNALYELTSAGERAQEDMREFEREPLWWNR